MLIGVGNDILEMERLRRAMAGKRRFAEFCFTSEELAAFSNRPDAIKKLAGCFCAKEAFSKALGTGVRGFSLTDISVLRDDLGKPYFVFSGRAKEIVDGLCAKAHLALTNTDTLVFASVVLEKQ